MKNIIFCMLLLSGVCVLASPPPPPNQPHRHHRHHTDVSWVGFAGGVLGGIIGSSLSKPTPPPPPPPYVQSPPPGYVWQVGHYEQQIQPNGVVVSVWIPGRWIIVR